MKRIYIFIILILFAGAGFFAYFKIKEGVAPQGNEVEKRNLIQVTSPLSRSLIQSPLKIEGRARGYWFFEASFPVKLVDGNGQQIGSTAIAQAQSEWMTEDFVPFRVLIEFQSPRTKWGTLILEKDNPSGLPQNADELRIPVRFY